MSSFDKVLSLLLTVLIQRQKMSALNLRISGWAPLCKVPDSVPDSAAEQSCQSRPVSSDWSSSYLQAAPSKLTLEKKKKKDKQV